jgi:hypothetical protein
MQAVIDHDAFFKRVLDIHNDQDWDRFVEVYTPDTVEEYPQSGEVFRGLANVRAIREHYPGGLLESSMDRDTIRLAASEEKWVMTPMYTAVRIEGSGSVGTAVIRIRYPEGVPWWTIIQYELRDGLIAHATTYFAQEFEAPDWRAPFRESP